MLLLDDGSLAVADKGSDGVLLFEAASVSRAVLQSEQDVPADASLVAEDSLSLSLLESGHLAVGTLGSVLLFESASISHALLEPKHNVTPSASLAAHQVSALELLKGGHLAVGTSSRGVLLFEAASMSRAMRGAMRDVQANASLAAGSVNSLHLLEDGNLAVAFDNGAGCVLLFESSSLSRTVAEARMQVQANATLMEYGVLSMTLLDGGHLAVSTWQSEVWLFESARISRAVLESSRAVPQHMRGVELRDGGHMVGGVRSAILEGISDARPRTTVVTLPLDPDVVFKVCGVPITLPLLQVQSGALFAGGYAWVSDAPLNELSTAYYSPCSSGSMSTDNGSSCVPCQRGFSSFEQSASCYIPLWRPASWQIVPPVVTLVVGIAVHQRRNIPGWMSASALFFSVVAGYVLSFTRSGRCGIVLVAGSALIATRLFGRCSTDTQQVVNLIEMMFLGMAFMGTLTMIHLALHGGITGELTVLGILSYHKSLLLEATAAALACALCIFVIGSSPASTPAARAARRSRTGTRDSGAPDPDSPSQESTTCENTSSDSQICRDCGAVPCRHIDVVERPKLPLPTRWQEALPTRLKDALWNFLTWTDTAVGFQTILFVNFFSTLCVLVSYTCLHGASISNRSQLMLALCACSFVGCLLTLLCVIGFATDRHARKALAVKSVLIPLKIWFLIIPGSFELTHDKVAVEVPSWRTWQCVAGTCPHMCTELPNGHCLFNQYEDVTICTCEFLGIPHGTLRYYVDSSDCLLVLARRWQQVERCVQIAE